MSVCITMTINFSEASLNNFYIVRFDYIGWVPENKSSKIDYNYVLSKIDISFLISRKRGKTF